MLIEQIQLKERESPPLSIGEQTVTLKARALLIRGAYGGFVRNRPTAVLVGEGEAARHYRVPDLTRILLIYLGVFNALFTLGSIWLSLKKRR